MQSPSKPHKKHIATIEDAPVCNLPELTVDNALGYLVELLKKLNDKAAARGVSVLEVRAMDIFDRAYDPSGIAYLLYVANEIEKKKQEIENKTRVKLRFKQEYNNEKYQAMLHFFPNFPENFQLALDLNKDKKEEDILKAAMDARNIARSKEAVKIAAKASDAAASCAEQATQMSEHVAIIEQARGLSAFMKKLQAESDKELKDFRDKSEAKRAADELAEAQKKARQAEEKAAIEKRIADQRREDEANEKNSMAERKTQRRPTLPDPVEEKKYPVTEIKEVKHGLLEKAQAKLEHINAEAKNYPDFQFHFEKKAAITEEVINYLKEKTRGVKPEVLDEKYDKEIILTFLAKKKFADVNFKKRCLNTLKHYHQRILEEKYCMDVKRAEKNEAMLFLLEDMIIIEQEASFKRALAYLLEQTAQLTDDNVLKTPLITLHKELAKIENKIQPKDLPTIMNVMKTIPIPTPDHQVTINDLRKYQHALIQAENTSLGNRPWNKTRIGMLCFGILGAVSGLALVGFSVATLVLSHGLVTPIVWGGIKIGLGLLITGSAMVYSSTTWKRNSLFSSAYEVSYKASKFSYQNSLEVKDRHYNAKHLVA